MLANHTIYAFFFLVKKYCRYLFLRTEYLNFIKSQLQTDIINGRIRSYIIKIELYVIPFVEFISQSKLSTEEENNLLLSAALTPIFDDFIDLRLLSISSINKIIDGEELIDNDYRIIIFINGYKKLLNRIYDKETFKKQMQIILENEKAGSQNTFQSLEKGANALILYLLVLNRNYSDLQLDISRLMGEFFQLLDDIFDVEKDRKNEQLTIPVIYMNDRAKLKDYLQLSKNKIINHPIYYSLSKKNKKKFIALINFLEAVALIKWKKTKVS
jgi:hypothetical protein